MNTGWKKQRSAVRRDRAESYLLTSLVSFGVTVILTRALLQLTGFPQIGNSVLHIAHALWGGLLLFAAVLLPLTLANLWAIRASALLSGVGIGLFIDEVGKFITQANDYFFPPALPLIYGFFLLTCFVYLYLRRPRREGPRTAMYLVLERLQEALDGGLDRQEVDRIGAQIAVARQSDRKEIVALADAIGHVMDQEKARWTTARPGIWRRSVARVDAVISGLRRGRHRVLIAILMIVWLALAISFIVVLALRVPTVNAQIVEWQTPLIIIQALVGSLMTAALVDWLKGKEERGMRFAVSGFLLSLLALQTIYFYLSQFSAITATLLQLAFLQVLLAYRRRYLTDNRIIAYPVAVTDQ